MFEQSRVNYEHTSGNNKIVRSWCPMMKSKNNNNNNKNLLKQLEWEKFISLKIGETLFLWFVRFLKT